MISVYEPVVSDEDISAVLHALKQGEISGSFGATIPEFERQFSSYCNCKYGIAVSSGTAALQLAVTVAGIEPGDEILMNASTNIATALAAFHNGAVPVPIDSDQSWNLDLELLERQITPRTRGIIAVHLYGHPVDMDRLMAIAKKNNLFVIEDCAESHGATCRGVKTGSFGEMGCFSFYANKTITTGEGGMVVTNDERLAEKLRLLRNLAFAQPRFLHREAGFNFRMTGFQAAMGLSQLQRIEEIIRQKRRVAHLYNRYLARIPGLQLPGEAEWARNVYWMYGVVVRPEFGISRDDLMKYLSEAGIETRTFFCPLNLQPFLQKQPGFRNVECPVAEKLWHTGFYLPSTYTLSESVIESIASQIERAFQRKSV